LSLPLARFVRSPLVFLALAVTVSASAIASCSAGDDLPTVFKGPDGGSEPPPKDGGNLVPDASPPMGTLRFVHAAEGLPALDFCTRKNPQDLFVGPVFGRERPRDGGTDARADSALADAAIEASTDAGIDSGSDAADAGGTLLGVPYLTTSQYVSVEGIGTLEVAVIAAGTGSCADPLATGVVTLESGKLKTAVVYVGSRLPGDGGPDARDGASEGGTQSDAQAEEPRFTRLASYDDTPEITPNRAKVRLVYATGEVTPGLTATLYATEVTTLGTLEAGQVLRADGDAGTPVDTLGYATVAPRPPPTTLGLRAEGTSAPALSKTVDLGLIGGSLHTGFVVKSSARTEVLWCNDVATDGPRTQCSVLMFP
jgi:hypothetical protein